MPISPIKNKSSFWVNGVTINGTKGLKTQQTGCPEPDIFCTWPWRNSAMFLKILDVKRFPLKGDIRQSYFWFHHFSTKLWKKPLQSSFTSAGGRGRFRVADKNGWGREGRKNYTLNLQKSRRLGVITLVKQRHLRSSWIVSGIVYYPILNFR